MSGEGIGLLAPASLDEALQFAGLNRTVDEVELMTADDSQSRVPKRKALVRADVDPHDARRVLGVVHRGFVPVQNRDAARLFDGIFGRGQRVYHGDVGGMQAMTRSADIGMGLIGESTNRT
jgi:hypothetical protein